MIIIFDHKHLNAHCKPLGVLNLNLSRGVPPRPRNRDPVFPIYDFQLKFHSFFHQNVWLLDTVYYKKSLKIFEFETLFMSGQSKNQTQNVAHPRIAYDWEYPPPLMFKTNLLVNLNVLLWGWSPCGIPTKKVQIFENLSNCKVKQCTVWVQFISSQNDQWSNLKIWMTNLQKHGFLGHLDLGTDVQNFITCMYLL